VLLLHGADDARVTTPQAQAVFDRLNGKKRFRVFDGAGHRSYMTSNPQSWKAEVGGFLKQHLPEAR
jgi:dipeptidyl aminopeptidase/acylaminoacyl peptidase